MKIIMKPIMLFLCAALLQACSVEKIISSDDMPSTENGTFTENGRFFVAGGSFIYEVKSAGGEAYRHEILVSGDISGEPCIFSGMTSTGNTIYATCTIFVPTDENILGLRPTTASLYRIDLDNGYIDTVLLPYLDDNFAANGMAVMANGDILLSNFVADIIPGEAAIIKVSIVDDENFEVEWSDWLSAEKGGKAPNGLQIEGNTLYFASGNTLSKIIIDENGEAESIEKLYSTIFTNILDDLAILEDSIAVAEISYPGVSPVDVQNITFIDKDSGKLVSIVPMPDNTAKPSSISLAKGNLFPGDALIITDYFNGGLYMLTGYEN